MATKKSNKEEGPIAVALTFKFLSVPIVGIAPLIVNKFGHEAQTGEVPDKEHIEGIWGAGADKPKPGGKKPKKAQPTPEEEYEKTIYYLSDGKRTGFPAVAFKAAMVRAASTIYGETMTSVRTKFHIMADDLETGLVEIKGKPEMRFDTVKVGGMTKVAAPRYRAQYPTWSATINIRYIENVISPEQLVNYLNAAGFACGVGEWRPEKCNSGSFGLFRVFENK